MITELSFLLELLLDHKLRKETKDAIQARIRDISNHGRNQGYTRPINNVGATIPLTEATPAAAKALADRNNAIQQAMSGKAEPGATSPRKFRGNAS